MLRVTEWADSKIVSQSTDIDNLSEHWDVVVIGAGPAGSTAAIQLARAGVKVLLVDKQRFPRHKICGCCLSAATLSLLTKYRLAPELDAINNVINQLHLFTRLNSTVIDIPAGKAVSRAILDSALALMAIESGAKFCQGVTATILESADNGLTRLVKLSGSHEKIIRSSIVIAADGLLGNSLRHIKALSTVKESGNLISAGMILEEAPDYYKPGNIYMLCPDKGYLGLVRLQDGSLDIAAALNLEIVKQYHGPANLVEHYIDEAGLPRIKGLKDGAWRGTRALTRSRVNLAYERIFVIGDAGGYVEPFTGEGIAWAISSGVLISPLALAAIANWDPSMSLAWDRSYKHHMSSKQAFCKVVSAVLSEAVFRETCVLLLSVMPAIAKPFVSQMNRLDMQETKLWR